jgi:CelD/BcsL family acetyltransferase involved in cellulose biosynthesis
MRFNDKLIASDLGFLMNGVFFSVKVAYDESFSRYSPGQLLNRHIIEDLWENGSTTFDLMGTRMPYKMVWTTEVREHSHCYIFRPSLKGRLLHTATMRGGRALRALKYRVWGDPQGVGEKP